ncbi:hypothetical protein R3P38DRAFT_109926 [Favolaschia claudopus]|uniref:Uncharacterized protein n=1 Tax=Favolaschia claudopus TaxID=2862362 RepID=A0AAV9ZXJ9_9AGAR
MGKGEEGSGGNSEGMMSMTMSLVKAAAAMWTKKMSSAVCGFGSNSRSPLTRTLEIHICSTRRPTRRRALSRAGSRSRPSISSDNDRFSSDAIDDGDDAPCSYSLVRSSRHPRYRRHPTPNLVPRCFAVTFPPSSVFFSPLLSSPRYSATSSIDVMPLFSPLPSMPRHPAYSFDALFPCPLPPPSSHHLPNSSSEITPRLKRMR